jgi:arylsulfatase A
MGFFEMTVCLCRFFGMRGRTFLLLLLVGLMAGGIQAKPNVIFVLVDNLGNGDVKCFNAESLHRTPNLDQMAAEGMKLTSFYACSGVCTPSRASAMTGCYPRRVNLHENHESRGVLRPLSPKGLHPDEVTMAEVLKAAGYATKIIGKWHLGISRSFCRHGRVLMSTLAFLTAMT